MKSHISLTYDGGYVCSHLRVLYQSAYIVDTVVTTSISYWFTMTKADYLLVSHFHHELAMTLLLVRTWANEEQPPFLSDIAELMTEDEGRSWQSTHLISLFF